MRKVAKLFLSKVCYCTSQCYEPSSYQEIPGSIKLASSTFLYSLNPGKVFRKSLLGPTSLQIMVERPSFGSFSNAMSWELKVRDAAEPPAGQSKKADYSAPSEAIFELYQSQS